MKGPKGSKERPKKVFGLCSFCTRTEAPLWRPGPEQYPSLCNACGMRWYRFNKKESSVQPFTQAALDSMARKVRRMPQAWYPDVCTECKGRQVRTSACAGGQLGNQSKTAASHRPLRAESRLNMGCCVCVFYKVSLAF
jgi:hypothetical protein